MWHTLRRTTAHLQLSYGDGAASDGLIGRRFMLASDGSALTLHIDLGLNFEARNRQSAGYLDAGALLRNHDRLHSLQCEDNLVRARLVRTWKAMHEPQLTMVLDLGTHGQFAYAVRPHLLFTGGVQLEVLQVLDTAPLTGGAHEAA